MWKLKFRIWDGFDMHYEGMMLPISGTYNEDMVIQQFTGFQDKNGRDIYEGDILEIQLENLHFVATVLRNTENYSLYLQPEVENIQLCQKIEQNIVVIANIYENENPTFYMP